MKLAIPSLVLGILAFLFTMVPILGQILLIAGFITGFLALKEKQRKFAIAGLILCSISLIVMIISYSLAVFFVLKYN